MDSVVLDASALLALLHKERGSELVERNLPGAALLTVNYSEVLKKTIENGGAQSAADSFIRQLQLQIIPFDERLASDTAALCRQYARKNSRGCEKAERPRTISRSTAMCFREAGNSVTVRRSSVAHSVRSFSHAR